MAQHQLVQHLGQGLESGGHDDGGDDERLVLGLVVHVDTPFLEHLLGNFTVFAVDTGDVCRQAVHVQSIASLRGCLKFLRVFPLGQELLALLQILLLQRFHGTVVGFAVTKSLRSFGHQLHRSPRFGVDDVGILDCLFHAGDDLELATALLGVLFGDVDDRRQQLVALGMGERYVHTETCQQTDQSLRNRQWLPIAR
eukprot:TRINITY_DN16301_c0_g1_i1.p2 TRINITY_DN16301_c0_g1~~TRINITY_DN16301_c0_g1_i1.p2  ORF type:complete len:197 (-),score=-44.54 TRINITY_DN16301_c0_g1_i1:685-1275(-)